MLALTLLLLPAGCAFSESSIKVIQHAEVSKPLDRVYVVVFQNGSDWREASLLKEAMDKALRSHALAERSTVITGLELSRTPVEADILRFRPDGILVLTPLGGGEVGSGGSLRGSYRAELSDPKGRTRIWLARLRNEGSPMRMGTRMEMMADDLVQELVWDGALREKKSP